VQLSLNAPFILQAFLSRKYFYKFDIDIHGDEEMKGLKDYEIKFMELMEKISSGAKIEISKSGTSVRYYPGILFNNGGVEFEFDCGIERGIGYFLEPLICLGFFGKTNLEITLTGVTNDEIDLSVDYFSQNFLPLLKNFGIETIPQIKILKRGFKPLGGGEIHLSVSFVKFLKTISQMNKGKIKRIRGTAYASKVAIQTLNRMISSAREIFNDYIPDVWIYSDYYKGNKAGLSSGYGMSLTAESNSGGYIGVEEIFKIDKGAGDEENLPEMTGKRCALRLLDEIYYVSINFEIIKINKKIFRVDF